MTRRQVRINNIVSELCKRMLRDHLGRWCEITMKRDGKKFKVVRDGYGPMEYPEWDKCRMIEVENDLTVGEFKDLYELADYIVNIGY